MFHYSVLKKENCLRGGSGTSDRTVGSDGLVNRDATGPVVSRRQTPKSLYRLPSRISGSNGSQLLAHTALNEQGYTQANTGDLCNRSTNLGSRWAFAAETKPSVGSTARLVPLDGDISCANTVNVFGAQGFVLKKMGDFVCGGNCVWRCARKSATERLLEEVLVNGTFRAVASAEIPEKHSPPERLQSCSRLK